MKYFGEGLGTFALVFCGTGAIMMNGLAAIRLLQSSMAMASFPKSEVG